MVLGDLDSYIQKNETQPPIYTIYKNKLKINKRLKYKLWYHKSPGRKYRKISDIPRSNIFTHMSSWARDIKERINKWDLTNIKASAWLKKTSAKWKGNQLYGKIYLPKTMFWSPKYIKNSHDSTPRRQTVQLKIGQRTWTDT